MLIYILLASIVCVQSYVFNNNDIKLLSSLNVVVYPNPHDLGTNIKNLYVNNDGIFGTLDKEHEMITNRTAQIFDKLQAVNHNLTDHLLGKSSKFSSQEDRLHHDYTTDVGPAWINYETDTQDIVVFRGTWSDGDRMNYLNHAKYWLFENVQTYSYKLYQDYYGNSTNKNITLEPRDAKFVFESLISRVATYFILKYQNPLHSLNEDDKAYVESIVSLREWEELGYGLIIKKIVDDKIKSKSGKQLIFTGHSQGGYMSQIASLYAASKGVIVPTLTFNAVGVKCNGRLSELLGDVSLSTDHIVNIKDKLDIYVSFDQSYGRSCFYDNQYKLMTEKYCIDVAGKNGYSVEAGELKSQFSKCRYFTHSIWRVYESTELELPLNCNYRNEVVTCPTKYPMDVMAVGITVLTVLSIIVLMLLYIGILFCCCKKDERAKRLERIRKLLGKKNKLPRKTMAPTTLPLMKINPYLEAADK